jgi:hypothetical protein
MSERILRIAQEIRSWWAQVPLEHRKTQYRLRDIPVEGSSRTLGPALRELGWVYNREKKDGGNRLWIPPVKELTSKSEDAAYLRGRMKVLESELASVQKQSIQEETIKRKILGLKHAVESTPIPEWVLAEPRPHSSPGIPTLFISDLHWGEVVQPSQINNVNRYNLQIAHDRMKTLVDSALVLLRIISPKLDYPGIVVPLGGDMISGNIHEELTATNELNTMPTVIDLYGVLCSLIAKLADEFGRVFLPCVTGNHGRDTRKIWAKDRHATSFDWLLYVFLAKHFERDKRIQFLIPDGPGAYYRVYNHRYLLSHGDQFRGGDGMIGALGPIIRGDHKKRSRNTQIDQDYDTLLLGHWHSYMHLTRLIVNGTLKGYDEYAYAGNFPFEQPQQALWITHPRHGITFRMPVYVNREKATPKANWVEVPA